MKTKLITLLLLSFSFLATAQIPANSSFKLNYNRKPFKDIRKKTIFSLSPFHFFDNSFSVATEMFLSNTYKTSLRIALTGMYADNLDKSDKGIALEVSGRYYPMAFDCDSLVWGRNQASGIYLGYGAQAGINNYRKTTINSSYYDPISGQYVYSDIVTKRESVWISPFVCFGYQFTVYESIYVDVYIGGAMKMNEVNTTIDGRQLQNSPYQQENPSIFDRNYKGILPKAGFTLGIGF
jgi:hypothetical protein